MELAQSSVVTLDFSAAGLNIKESNHPCIPEATKAKLEGFWGQPPSVREISGIEASMYIL